MPPFPERGHTSGMFTERPFPVTSPFTLARPPMGLARVGLACLALAGCGSDAPAAAGAMGLDHVTFDTVATVGIMDGDDREVFGAIWEVASGPGGVFAVLDRQTPRISIFDAAGDFVGEVAGQGAGPGELARPYALTWTSDGELLALDPANARISAFRVEDGEAEGLEGALRAIAMEDLAAVRLHCEPERGRILEVGIMNPRIQLLEAGGTPVWTTELDEIFPLVPEVVNGGGVGMRVDPETGAHLARSIVPWDREHVLILERR